MKHWHKPARNHGGNRAIDPRNIQKYVQLLGTTTTSYNNFVPPTIFPTPKMSAGRGLDVHIYM